jgi:hypothetical protein
MNKKLHKEDDGIEVHIGAEIRKELSKQERSVTWLSEKIEHDSSNLNKQLNAKYINYKWLYRISKVLNKDFFTLYSKQLADEK